MPAAGERLAIPVAEIATDRDVRVRARGDGEMICTLLMRPRHGRFGSTCYGTTDEVGCVSLIPSHKPAASGALMSGVGARPRPHGVG